METIETRISEGMARTLTAKLLEAGAIKADSPIEESSFENTCVVSSSIAHNGRTLPVDLYSVMVRKDGTVCIASHLKELTGPIKKAYNHITGLFPEYEFTMTYSRYPRGNNDGFA